MERVAFLLSFSCCQEKMEEKWSCKGFAGGLLDFYPCVCSVIQENVRKERLRKLSVLCGVFVHGKIESERERSEMTGFHSGFCGTCGIFRVFVCKGVESGEEMGEREGFLRGLLCVISSNFLV